MRFRNPLCDHPGTGGRYFLTAGCIFLFLGIPSVLFGQQTARALGMGEAYTALARGVHAPAWNPANLGLPDNPRFSMTFVSAGAGVWNNSFSKSLYDKYNGEYLSSRDIDDILSHIPDGGLDVDGGVSARVLSFSTNRFAFSMGADGGSFFRVDKTLFDLALEGNETDRTYSLGNTEGGGVGVGVVGLSWGQPVRVSFADAFAVGGTLHFLYGIGYAESDKADFTLDMREYDFDLNGEYEVTHALGGLGWGLDLGAALQFGDEWTVSLGLANLLGSIPWSREVEKEKGYVQGDSLAVWDFDDDLADSSWTASASEFSTKLPTVLRLGCSHREGSVLVTGDYRQGFCDGPMTRTRPRVAVGAEWSAVKWFPLRTGMVLGGRTGFGTSLGFGLRTGGFVFDVGMLSRGFAFPGSSKGYVFGLEFGMELGKPVPAVVPIDDSD